MRFDKDAWIKRALARRVYVVRPEDGRIYKWKSTVQGKRIYKPVVPQVHKKSGRVYFTMTFEGITKSALVNRVVALALIPNPDGKPEVNHIDGNKENNRPENLEWSDRSEQEKHAFATGLKSSRGGSNSNAKLQAGDIASIRAAAEEELDALAQRLGVSRRTLINVRKGITWNHV